MHSQVLTWLAALAVCSLAWDCGAQSSQVPQTPVAGQPAQADIQRFCASLGRAQIQRREQADGFFFDRSSRPTFSHNEALHVLLDRDFGFVEFESPQGRFTRFSIEDETSTRCRWQEEMRAANPGFVLGLRKRGLASGYCIEAKVVDELRSKHEVAARHEVFAPDLPYSIETIRLRASGELLAQHARAWGRGMSAPAYSLCGHHQAALWSEVLLPGPLARAIPRRPWETAAPAAFKSVATQEARVARHELVEERFTEAERTARWASRPVTYGGAQYAVSWLSDPPAQGRAQWKMTGPFLDVVRGDDLKRIPIRVPLPQAGYDRIEMLRIIGGRIFLVGETGGFFQVYVYSADGEPLVFRKFIVKPPELRRPGYASSTPLDLRVGKEGIELTVGEWKRVGKDYEYGRRLTFAAADAELGALAE